ncbi:MAG: DUF5990 family protein [Candidatus Poribacteria bacterium]
MLKLRIVAVNPPVGFWFWLKDDKGNNFSITESKGEDITFDFDVIVKENKKNSSPNFAGSFASGTANERFFYVNYGKIASQMEGRAKIWISGKHIKSSIDWKIIKETASDPGKLLMAKYKASGKDGKLASATVELIDGVWFIARN